MIPTKGSSSSGTSSKSTALPNRSPDVTTEGFSDQVLNTNRAGNLGIVNDRNGDGEVDPVSGHPGSSSSQSNRTTTSDKDTGRTQSSGGALLEHDKSNNTDRDVTDSSRSAFWDENGAFRHIPSDELSNTRTGDLLEGGDFGAQPSQNRGSSPLPRASPPPKSYATGNGSPVQGHAMTSSKNTLPSFIDSVFKAVEEATAGRTVLPQESASHLRHHATDRTYPGFEALNTDVRNGNGGAGAARQTGFGGQSTSYPMLNTTNVTSDTVLGSEGSGTNNTKPIAQLSIYVPGRIPGVANGSPLQNFSRPGGPGSGLIFNATRKGGSCRNKEEECLANIAELEREPGIADPGCYHYNESMEIDYVFKTVTETGLSNRKAMITPTSDPFESYPSCLPAEDIANWNNYRMLVQVARNGQQSFRVYVQDLAKGVGKKKQKGGVTTSTLLVTQKIPAPGDPDGVGQIYGIGDPTPTPSLAQQDRVPAVTGSPGSDEGQDSNFIADDSPGRAKMPADSPPDPGFQSSEGNTDKSVPEAQPGDNTNNDKPSNGGQHNESPQQPPASQGSANQASDSPESEDQPSAGSSAAQDFADKYFGAPPAEDHPAALGKPPQQHSANEQEQPSQGLSAGQQPAAPDTASGHATEQESAAGQPAGQENIIGQPAGPSAEEPAEGQPAGGQPAAEQTIGGQGGAQPATEGPGGGGQSVGGQAGGDSASREPPVSQSVGQQPASPSTEGQSSGGRPSGQDFINKFFGQPPRDDSDHGGSATNSPPPAEPNPAVQGSAQPPLEQQSSESPQVRQGNPATQQQDQGSVTGFFGATPAQIQPAEKNAPGLPSHQASEQHSGQQSGQGASGHRSGQQISGPPTSGQQSEPDVSGQQPGGQEHATGSKPPDSSSQGQQFPDQVFGGPVSGDSHSAQSSTGQQFNNQFFGQSPPEPQANHGLSSMNGFTPGSSMAQGHSGAAGQNPQNAADSNPKTPPTVSTNMGNVPIKLSPENVVIGDQTFSRGDSPASAIVNGQNYNWDSNSFNGPSQAIPFPSDGAEAPAVIVGGKDFKVYPSNIEIASSTIRRPPDSKPLAFNVDGQRFWLTPSQLISPDENVSLPPANKPAPFVYKGQTLSADKSYLFAGTTSIPLSPSGVVSYKGQRLTVNPTEIIAPDTRIALSPTQGSGNNNLPSTVTTGGHVLSIGPDAAIVGSNTYAFLPGKAPETFVDHGEEITVGSQGVKFGTNSIPIPTSTPDYKVETYNGVTFSVAPSEAVVGGIHIQNVQSGMAPMTTVINGQTVNVGPKGIGFVSTTIPLPSPTPSYSITTQGDLTLSLAPSEAVIKGHTYDVSPESPSTTEVIDGRTIGIGPSGIHLQGTSVDLPTVNSGTAQGVSYSVGATEAVLGGTTYPIGSNAPEKTIMVGSETLKVGTEGLVLPENTLGNGRVMPGTTIPPGRRPAPSPTFQSVTTPNGSTPQTAPDLPTAPVEGSNGNGASARFKPPLVMLMTAHLALLNFGLFKL